MSIDVLVIDALCGQGKSKKFIEQMATMPDDKRIIYITPLLSETHRIAGTRYDPADEKRKVIKDDLGLYDYNIDHPLYHKRFRHPESQQGDGKIGGLKYLISQNENIVATHALFQMLTPEIVQEIQVRDYHLFMDEVIDVWNIWKEEDEGLKKYEISQMIDNNHLIIDDVDGVTLRFNRERFGNPEGTAYQDISALCDLSQLLYISNTVIWQMPFSALQAFKSVRIGTYLFEGSLLSAYLKYFGANVRIENFGKRPSEIKHLIHIIDGEKNKKLNAVGDGDNALSYTKLTDKKQAGKALRDQLRKNLETLYKGSNRPKSSQKDRLWTVPKYAVKQVAGTHYKASWLASTTKATNDYSDRWYLAYLLEKNPKPPIVALLSRLGVSISKEKYALGEIVQWVWRSRIRNEKPIHLYMPSKAMRTLFKEWLDDKHHFSTSNEHAFFPTTTPFHKNGQVSKEWHDAALKAGVHNKSTWEEFRSRLIDMATSQGAKLKLPQETLPMPCDWQV